MKPLEVVEHPADPRTDNRPTLVIKEREELNADGSSEPGAFVARMHPDRLEYAQLFAAAPDLFAALEELAQVVPFSDRGALGKAINAARNALSNARGE